MDDDENWNLLAQSSPERLSAVPKAPYQDVPYITRAERQQVLPEQHVKMPFTVPVSPKHGPQEPKYHRSPVNSAQPQEVLALAPCGSIARHGTCHKAETPFCLKKPSCDSSVIVLSPSKSSGDASSPARHIQGAGTACLLPFTRGQTFDCKNNEAKAESRYSQIQWQRLEQYYVAIRVNSQCCVGTAGPVTGHYVHHVLKCTCKACMLLYASSKT